ncbi:MAG: ankyrin repeat domain-containing protein [Hyphomonadaceae bacterium]|nr:ankyrin repeat domain-containing protein [Hyphomonadaceae bacterium]
MGADTARSAQEEAQLAFLNALNEGGGIAEAAAYLDAGGDINVAIVPMIEQTLLHYATIHRHIDLIELLARRGADLDARNAFGMTAMHLAVQHELDAILLQWQEADFPCARKLFRLGASSDVVDNNGKTPRDYAGPKGTPMRAAFDEALMDPDD